jgi:hypothetical protein
MLSHPTSEVQKMMTSDADHIEAPGKKTTLKKQEENYSGHNRLFKNRVNPARRD